MKNSLPVEVAIIGLVVASGVCIGILGKRVLAPSPVVHVATSPTTPESQGPEGQESPRPISRGRAPQQRGPSSVTERLARQELGSEEPGARAAEAMARLVGEPLPWDDEHTREVHMREVVEVSEFVAQEEGATFLSTDCASYPCISFFEGTVESGHGWREGHRVLLIDFPYVTDQEQMHLTAAIDIPPDIALTDESAVARAWDHLAGLRSERSAHAP